jgi:hypothetical protein
MCVTDSVNADIKFLIINMKGADNTHFGDTTEQTGIFFCKVAHAEYDVLSEHNQC